MALPRRRSPSSDQDEQASISGAHPDWHALYEIENPADVDAYVRSHPGIVSVLERASVEITSRFGADTTLVLELVVDPDDEPASEFLTVDIQTNLDDDEAYARRHRMD